MFCGKCGTKNADNALFCVRCGAKLGGRVNINGESIPGNNGNGSGRTTIRPAGEVVSGSTPHALSSATVNKGNKNRIVGIIAVAVVAVLIIVAAFWMFGGRGYKATINEFVNCTKKMDVKGFLKLMPDEVIDYGMKEEGYDSRSEVMEELEYQVNKQLKSTMESISGYLGDDWTLSHKIVDAENITGDDLAELKHEYKDEGIDINISAAKNVEVELTVTSGETESSNSVEIPLIKVGRSWYLDVMSGVSLF